MSVDVNAKIGLGWIISHEEYREMCEAAGDQWDDIEGYFHYIDCYRDKSDIFLGENICSIDEGRSICLDEVLTKRANDFDEDKFSNTYGEILEVCGRSVTPDSKWATAKLYLIHELC
jgi:hypothetical protein